MTKHARLTLAFSLLLGACGGGSAATAETASAEPSTSGSETAPAFTQITVDDVDAGLAANSLSVFDANAPATFAEHHVPSATWVDHDGVTAEQLPADHSRRLVFYCANEQCSASHTAAETAVGLGYTDVTVMGAGIQGWIAAGKSVETGAAPAAE